MTKDEAMQMALEHIEGDFTLSEEDVIKALRAALAQTETEPVANEVKLNIIRWWPDGFAKRLEDVWKDLIGFIPNYKLYDLQQMLAEFGLTMKIYEGAAPPQREWVGLTDEEISEVLGGEIHDENSGMLTFIRAIEQALKEKNT